MHTTLEHLTPQQNLNLQILLNRLVTTFPIVRIVCFDIKQTNSTYWSGLNKQLPLQRSRLTIGLLMMLDKDATSTGADIINLVQTTVKPQESVNCIIYKQVEENAFINKLLHAGTTLYRKRVRLNTDLTEPPVHSQPARLITMPFLNPLNTAS